MPWSGGTHKKSPRATRFKHIRVNGHMANNPLLIMPPWTADDQGRSKPHPGSWSQAIDTSARCCNIQSTALSRCEAQPRYQSCEGKDIDI